MVVSNDLLDIYILTYLILYHFTELCLIRFFVLCFPPTDDLLYSVFCILYSSCHTLDCLSCNFGIVYAHLQFTLGNFNTLVLLIGGH